MRLGATYVFIVFIILLFVSVIASRFSHKPIGRSVVFLNLALMIPVVGNLIIIISRTQNYSTLGYYTYFIGMDISVFALFRFTLDYCNINLKNPRWPEFTLYALIAGDVIQFILNPFFHQAFSTEMLMVDKSAYYRIIPFLGQTCHRIICYGIFFVILTIFIYKWIKVPKIYSEKYSIIMIAILVAGGVEAYYILSRKPIDIAMIGLAIMGLLVYYFAIVYRPVRLLDRMLASVVSDMPEALYFFDKSGQCIWANGPGCFMGGVKEGEYDNVKDNLQALFGEIEFSNPEWSNNVEIGEGDDTRYYNLDTRPVTDTNDNLSGMLLNIHDSTESQREFMKQMYNSTHDSLTGLYAREYLNECIDKRLKSDKKHTHLILYVNISNFNIINDVFGNQFGDLTLKTIAENIKKNAQKNAIYGKISTHTFGLLVRKDLFDEGRLEEALSNFTIKDNNLEHHIVIHIGIYEAAPDDESDVDLMFESARLATSKLNEDSVEHIVYYDDMLRDEIVYDQLISNQLQDAIKEKQMRPYLQPIVNNDGTLVGAEALVRWIHPDDGYLSPAAFIPVFEKNGLIAEVDKYMWRCACEILTDWASRGIDAFISVNISPKDFYFLDVVKEIRFLVEEFKIDPVKLRIEITESVMMSDSDDRLKIVDEFRKLGFIVEIDDFGSGYSSFNLLKDMPVDVLKIDMMFLKDSEKNPRSNTIIQNIINMSEDLGIVSLTEGVETFEQYQKLAGMGCKLFQGYYFSKPVPVEDFEKDWFRRRAGNEV
ncbi:MAG: EAL domain-containing protein [Saccharofermentans sp.]|nr:EAL domain-containing protein [Saccharofermentans sp.]